MKATTTQRLARAAALLGLVVAVAALPAFAEPVSAETQDGAPYTMSQTEQQAWASLKFLAI